MACPMCITLPHRDGPRKQLTRDQIQTLLLEPAIRKGITQLIVGGGEPTLRHDLKDVLADAVALGMKVWLATNLLHVKESTMRDLLHLLSCAQHTIAVSFDSLVSSEMLVIRGGDYRSGVEANVRRLLALRREIGAATRIRASLIVQEENLHSVLPTVSHALDNIGFDEIGVYLRHDYQGVTLDNKDSQTVSDWCVRNRMELIRLGMQLFRRAQSDPRISLCGSLLDWINFVTDPQLSRRRCQAGNFLFFNAEGHLRTCMVGADYASVIQSPMAEIMASQGFLKAHELHESCSLCTLACS